MLSPIAEAVSQIISSPRPTIVRASHGSKNVSALSEVDRDLLAQAVASGLRATPRRHLGHLSSKSA